MLLAALLVAAAPQDDLAKRVAALVERLGSEEIGEREKATAELVKLGVPAFKAIQAEHGKTSGDIRQRLEGVIKRIDRTIRCDALLGPQVTATLKAEKRPLPEVLEELKKLSGQPIECRDIPADPVTLSLEKVQVWEALDRICQTHGGVMWRGEPGWVIVERKPYRSLPKVFNRNFAFYLTQFEDRLDVGRRGVSKWFNLHGGLLWTRGGSPSSVRLQLDEVKDDRGTDLLAGRKADLPWMVRDIEYPGLVQTDVNQGHSVIPDFEASKLSVCRGSLTLHIVLETKRILEIKEPEKAAGGQHETETVGVYIQDFKRTDDSLKSTVMVTLRAGQKISSFRPTWFAVRDARDKLHPARGHGGAFTTGVGGGPQVYFTLEWTLPPGTALAALELHVPTDTHELEFPFDFKDLPLK